MMKLMFFTTLGLCHTVIEPLLMVLVTPALFPGHVTPMGVMGVVTPAPSKKRNSTAHVIPAAVTDEMQAR